MEAVFKRTCTRTSPHWTPDSGDDGSCCSSWLQKSSVQRQARIDERGSNWVFVISHLNQNSTFTFFQSSTWEESDSDRSPEGACVLPLNAVKKDGVPTQCLSSYTWFAFCFKGMIFIALSTLCSTWFSQIISNFNTFIIIRKRIGSLSSHT